MILNGSEYAIILIQFIYMYINIYIYYIYIYVCIYNMMHTCFPKTIATSQWSHQR
jgi:hypothetical protein